MGLLSAYSRQALAYDSTRGASPSVLAPLRRALAGAPGRRLADIGGGTGNYALALAGEGWQPTVVDRSAQMLARASDKGLRRYARTPRACRSPRRPSTRRCSCRCSTTSTRPPARLPRPSACCARAVASR